MHIIHENPTQYCVSTFCKLTCYNPVGEYTIQKIIHTDVLKHSITITGVLHMSTKSHILTDRQTRREANVLILIS